MSVSTQSHPLGDFIRFLPKRDFVIATRHISIANPYYVLKGLLLMGEAS